MPKKTKKEYCSGQWTRARFKSFIMSALRSASTRWKPKHDCINDAFVEEGVNPRTGRKCKLHRCAISGKLFPKGEMHADHVETVMPMQFDDSIEFLGVNWNQVIRRMFVEKDGYQAISKEEHKKKTKEENRARK